MEQTMLYVKKLIVLSISAFVFYFLNLNFNYFIAAPLAFLILSYLHYRLTEEKPSYLFKLKEADEYLNQKGGFWLLFKWIVSLLGIMYDLIAWTFNGIYVLFLIIMDVLLLLKTIVYWLVHAVIWFLKLFVPPIVFLYKIFIHYLIKWPWWLYKLSYKNTHISIRKNFLIISLWGGIIALFLIGLFFGIAVLLDMESIGFIGVLFSVLPLVWSYAEISAIRKEGNPEKDYKDVRKNFASGYKAVRAVLFYLVIFLFALFVEVMLYMLGWIPSLGLSLLGISLNLNTLISVLLIFVFVILVFAKFLMPAHVVHHKDYENDLENSGRFLAVIGRKFLRYIMSHLPGGLFATILSILPVILVGIAVFFTLNLKDRVVETRIHKLEFATSGMTGIESLAQEEKIRNLEYFRFFPQKVFSDFINLKSLKREKEDFERDYNGLVNYLSKTDALFARDIDSLQNVVDDLLLKGDSISLQKMMLAERSLKRRNADYEKWREKNLFDQEKDRLKMESRKRMMWQLPVAFFFLVIWVSVFGGVVLAVIISYFGNLYHSLYKFREDGKPTFFRQQITIINSRERNQPLLGFTLIFLILIILIAFFGGYFDSLLTIRGWL